MNNPKISIITVCLNASTTIEQTILSVIQQSYNNIEYIIIDGNSFDGTIDIIKQYKENIRLWISEPDKGIYDAMNKGLKLATGDFLIFMGADDVFYNNHIISNVVSKIKTASCIYYGDIVFKDTEIKHWGQFNKIKWATTNVCHQAIFYPKTVYKQYEYDTTYTVYADYVYNLNLIKHKFVFKYINEIVSIFDNSGYSSYTSDLKFDNTKTNIIIKTLGLFPYIIGVLLRNIIIPIYSVINTKKAEKTRNISTTLNA